MKIAEAAPPARLASALGYPFQDYLPFVPDLIGADLMTLMYRYVLT